MPHSQEHDSFITTGKDNTILALAIVSGAILMILAAQGDLWLDELWSFQFAQLSTSFVEVFTRHKNDNNHLLNTLYLYCVKNSGSTVVFRLMSVFFGIASLIMISIIAKPFGRFERIGAVYLSAFSYLLIVYFSEARGYAGAIFFALSAFAIYQRTKNERSFLTRLLFGLCIICGFLSHLTFAIFFMAMFMFIITDCFTVTKQFLKVFKKMFAYFAIPLLFLFFFYMWYVREMELGGEPATSRLPVLFETISMIFGANGTFLKMISFIFFLATFLYGLKEMFKRNSPLGSFYIVLCILGPAVFISISGSTTIYPRFFIVCIPFYYLLLSIVLAEVYKKHGRLRVLCLIVATICILMNLIKIYTFFDLKRGAYSKAITDIASATKNDVIKIASDHEFRNTMVLDFYSKRLKLSKPLVYIDKIRMGAEKPEWFIKHNQGSAGNQPQIAQVEGIIGSYSLYGTYLSSELSGFNWFVYHRDHVVP